MVWRTLEAHSCNCECYIVPQHEVADLIVRWRNIAGLNLSDYNYKPEQFLEVVKLKSFDLTVFVVALAAEAG